MFQLHKKKLLIISALSAVVFVGVAAHTPQKQGPKNLKILPKDISDDSLHNLMKGFNASLGVKCGFCHAPSKDPNQKWPDFASDEKPEKEIARHMMTMTKDINTKYFNFMGSNAPDTIRAVTCITCHRGDAHPESLVPMAPPMPPGAPGGPGGPGAPPPPGGPGGPAK